VRREGSGSETPILTRCNPDPGDVTFSGNQMYIEPQGFVACVPGPVGPAGVLKRQRMGVRCISRFGDRSGEWIEAQVGGDPIVIRWCRSHLVAFPATECHGANSQYASRFRLVNLELKAASAEVTADCGRVFRNRDPADVGGQIFVARDANPAFTKRQRTAPRTVKCLRRPRFTCAVERPTALPHQLPPMRMVRARAQWAGG
jgi:hypothetical protein